MNFLPLIVSLARAIESSKSEETCSLEGKNKVSPSKFDILVGGLCYSKPKRIVLKPNKIKDSWNLSQMNFASSLPNTIQ